MVRSVSGAVLALALILGAPQGARAADDGAPSSQLEQVFLQLSGMG